MLRRRLDQSLDGLIFIVLAISLFYTPTLSAIHKSRAGTATATPSRVRVRPSLRKQPEACQYSTAAQFRPAAAGRYANYPHPWRQLRRWLLLLRDPGLSSPPLSDSLAPGAKPRPNFCSLIGTQRDMRRRGDTSRSGARVTVLPPQAARTQNAGQKCSLHNSQLLVMRSITSRAARSPSGALRAPARTTKKPRPALNNLCRSRTHDSTSVSALEIRKSGK